MSRLPIWTLGALLIAAPLTAQVADSEEAQRVREAATVLGELAGAPDKAVPRAVLERAEAIAIFPGLKKAGFVVGGQFGRGVMLVRNGDTWSPPAFLRLAGGSFGAQIGAQEVDLVLVVMNRRGVDNLLRNEFKIGGEASAAAGPVGREASAGTDLQLRAEILSYSRSRGLFAGATINGASVAEDKDANARFYGTALGTREIADGKATSVPPPAQPLMEALVRYVPARKAGG